MAISQRVAASVIAFVFTQTAHAADFQVCESIAGKAGALVDRSDSEQWRQSVDSEFTNVCRDTRSYEASLSGSSSGTQAAFGYAGFSLGFGQSASDQNSRTSEAIDAVCKTGKTYVSDYFHSVDKTVSGQYAVNLVSECLRILAQSDLEALTGTTEVSMASDAAFYVRIEFRPSSSSPGRKYKLVGIAVDPKAELKCTMDAGVDVVRNMTVDPQSQSTFTCTRKPDFEVNGAFNFKADSDGPTRSLRFSVPSLSGRELVREEIKTQLGLEMDEKIDQLRPFIVPRGGVVAIDDPAGCNNLGKGWSDAGLDGRFIAGANTTNFQQKGGAANYPLTGDNLPELNLSWRALLSGGDRSFRAVEGLVLGASQGPEGPKNPAGGIGKEAPTPIDTLPPYINLYFCKRI